MSNVRKVICFIRAGSECVSNQGVFRQRHEDTEEEMGSCGYEGKSIPGQKKSKCRNPAVGVCGMDGEALSGLWAQFLLRVCSAAQPCPALL